MMIEYSLIDLLNLKIDELLLSEENYKKVEIINNEIKFIDYIYYLSYKELDVFDKITIRIFDDQKTFNKKINTHITFNTTAEPDLITMITAVESLVKIYKVDSSGHTHLEDSEIDMLEKRDYWPGRVWDFNHHHGLWRLQDREEHFAYSVIITYDSLDEGFSLVIFGYNRLMDLLDNNK